MQHEVRRERSLAKSIQKKKLALLKLMTCQGRKVGGVVDPDLAIQNNLIGNNGSRERKNRSFALKLFVFIKAVSSLGTKVGAMFAEQ